MISQYSHVFDGRRVMVIANDGRTENCDSIVRDFPELKSFEIIPVANDAFTCETAHYLKVLERLVSNSPKEFTFYAHAKGVSRHESPQLPAIKAWTEVMYRLNLGCPEVIDLLMERYDSIGCFRWPNPPSPTEYLYCGSFFWFKHSALFATNWKDICWDRFGVENYLGRHISLSNSFCLTPHYPHNLYEIEITRHCWEMWFQKLKKLKSEEFVNCNQLAENSDIEPS